MKDNKTIVAVLLAILVFFLFWKKKEPVVSKTNTEQTTPDNLTEKVETNPKSVVPVNNTKTVSDTKKTGTITTGNSTTETKNTTNEVVKEVSKPSGTTTKTTPTVTPSKKEEPLVPSTAKKKVELKPWSGSIYYGTNKLSFYYHSKYVSRVDYALKDHTGKVLQQKSLTGLYSNVSINVPDSATFLKADVTTVFLDGSTLNWSAAWSCKVNPNQEKKEETTVTKPNGTTTVTTTDTGTVLKLEAAGDLKAGEKATLKYVGKNSAEWCQVVIKTNSTCLVSRTRLSFADEVVTLPDNTTKLDVKVESYNGGFKLNTWEYTYSVSPKTANENPTKDIKVGGDPVSRPPAPTIVTPTSGTTTVITKKVDKPTRETVKDMSYTADVTDGKPYAKIGGYKFNASHFGFVFHTHMFYMFDHFRVRITTTTGKTLVRGIFSPLTSGVKKIAVYFPENCAFKVEVQTFYKDGSFKTWQAPGVFKNNEVKVYGGMLTNKPIIFSPQDEAKQPMRVVAYGEHDLRVVYPSSSYSFHTGEVRKASIIDDQASYKYPVWLREYRHTLEHLNYKTKPFSFPEGEDRVEVYTRVNFDDGFIYEHVHYLIRGIWTQSPAKDIKVGGDPVSRPPAKDIKVGGDPVSRPPAKDIKVGGDPVSRPPAPTVVIPTAGTTTVITKPVTGGGGGTAEYYINTNGDKIWLNGDQKSLTHN